MVTQHVPSGICTWSNHPGHMPSTNDVLPYLLVCMYRTGPTWQYGADVAPAATGHDEGPIWLHGTPIASTEDEAAAAATAEQEKVTR